MAEILIFDKALTAADVVLLQEYYNNLYPSLTSGQINYHIIYVCLCQVFVLGFMFQSSFNIRGKNK